MAKTEYLVWAPASRTGKSHSSFLERHINLEISLLSDNDGDNNNESFSCDRLRKKILKMEQGNYNLPFPFLLLLMVLSDAASMHRKRGSLP